MQKRFKIKKIYIWSVFLFENDAYDLHFVVAFILLSVNEIFEFKKLGENNLPDVYHEVVNL